MADTSRLKHAASSGWRAVCGVVGVSLLLATQALAVVTMGVTTSDGVQGGSLTLTMEFVGSDGGDPPVANAQTDVIIDTTQIQVTGNCSNGGSACQSSSDCPQMPQEGVCVLSACKLAERLTAQSSSATSPKLPSVASGHLRLRLSVADDISHPTASISPGPLVVCTFPIPASAPANQPVSLTTERLSVGDTSFNTIGDAVIQVSPGQILPAPGTPTPTATPIPCFVDQDCPQGQVCDPTNKVCKPAPTPTPTIACPPSTECLVGLTCVNGICVDLSTPTPTPTPLPPCTSDSDCLAGFHCRANVCVPIRECDDADPVLDRSMCRGVRETCTNGECECGGDCNLDGYVLSNETTQMICVLSGQCLLSTCAAGDFNGDGQITGNEVCAAVTNLGLGCPAEGQPLVIDRSAETRSLDIGTASGFPGDTVTIGVGLSGGGDVATAQLDVLFDTAVLAIPHPDNPALDCQVDPRLAATDQTFTFSPQTPSTPMGMERLRLFVGNINICKDGLTYPVGAFDQGPLLSCTFQIRTDALPGDSALTGQRLNIGDPRGDVFGAVSTAGNVTVLELSPTPTNTVPTSTATATPTFTSTPTHAGPTVTPTVTPTATFCPSTTPCPEGSVRVCLDPQLMFPCNCTCSEVTPTPTPTPSVTPTPTNAGPLATPTRTPSPITTPVNTFTVIPDPTPTVGASPTPTNTVPSTPRTATPTATATVHSGGGGGGGGGGCTIGTAGIPGRQLLWLGVPVGLFVMRRRARRSDLLERRP